MLQKITRLLLQAGGHWFYKSESRASCGAGKSGQTRPNTSKYSVSHSVGLIGFAQSDGALSPVAANQQAGTACLSDLSHCYCTTIQAKIGVVCR